MAFDRRVDNRARRLEVFLDGRYKEAWWVSFNPLIVLLHERIKEQNLCADVGFLERLN